MSAKVAGDAGCEILESFVALFPIESPSATQAAAIAGALKTRRRKTERKGYEAKLTMNEGRPVFTSLEGSASHWRGSRGCRRGHTRVSGR